MRSCFATHLFGFDFENRLVEVKLKSTSALVATYRYDALGRRVEKVVTAGSTTRYVLDGVQVVEEYDGTGAWQARYLYEDGIDRPQAFDRADIADVNGNANTTEVLRFHYHQQALGSVTEVSQPTGAVVEWVTYDVYGVATIRDRLGATVASSAVGNPWLFTGRAFDAESGLYHYRARAYDPSAGRFLQRDPRGGLDGPNLRDYVQGGPVGYSDPLGTERKGWLDAAGLAKLRDDMIERAGDQDPEQVISDADARLETEESALVACETLAIFILTGVLETGEARHRPTVQDELSSLIDFFRGEEGPFMGLADPESGMGWVDPNQPATHAASVAEHERTHLLPWTPETEKAQEEWLRRTGLMKILEDQAKAAVCAELRDHPEDAPHAAEVLKGHISASKKDLQEVFLEVRSNEAGMAVTKKIRADAVRRSNSNR